MIQNFSYKIDEVDSLFSKRECVYRKASHFIILEQRFGVYRYSAGTQEGLFRVPTGIPGNVAALASLERYRSSFRDISSSLGSENLLFNFSKISFF